MRDYPFHKQATFWGVRVSWFVHLFCHSIAVTIFFPHKSASQCSLTCSTPVRRSFAQIVPIPHLSAHNSRGSVTVSLLPISHHCQAVWRMSGGAKSRETKGRSRRAVSQFHPDTGNGADERRDRCGSICPPVTTVKNHDPTITWASHAPLTWREPSIETYHRHV